MFPAGFLWGAATAATHVDGGDVNSDWYHWCQMPGKIKDGSSCFTACEHWTRYEEDFKIMKKLGLKTYRLGVDWSRFQHAPGAPFDRQALDHFRGMLSSLVSKRIRPLLTLNHFSIPQWWLEKGGWTVEENLKEFYDFIEFIVPGVGDLASDYITFNEPNVYAVMGYLLGDWPPGEKGLGGYLNSLKTQRHMLMAHFKLYDYIRETHAQKNWAAPQISIAKHMRVMDPANPENPLDLDRCREADYRFNRAFPDSIQEGRLLTPFGKGEKVHDGNAWDFFGLNYYTRDMISFSLWNIGSLFIKQEFKPDAPKNDLGWEIYPEGLYRLVRDVHERYGLPIRITENGVADGDDHLRGDYIKSHLTELHRAMQDGARVDAYYHWSFCDNFEWAEGYSARFGLVQMDYDSQKRILRPSADLYARIVRSGVVPA
ncbi:MAG: family 1 glycosylhydrolase [Leptospiraceae bacterium]|nr:family 1 glycosylhydrolase [Leptospiraceae bacterium]